jgi:acetyl/propionyl-CoA carboxylase alpha subunit
METLLIANRGEIAVRIARACREMGIQSVAVYSEPDRNALHVQCSDQAIAIGGESPADSYLDASRLLQAARESKADAIHPGYGFLAEDPAFAAVVEEAGLCWIGPPVAAMEAMASKATARTVAEANQVPVLPALTLEGPPDESDLAAVAALGEPLLIKAAAGGGGIGMRTLAASDDVSAVLEQAQQQARRQFGSDTLLVERLLVDARHVEVQVLADQHGNLLHLFDRDCSLQRRRQKIIEEAPAPGLPEALREAMYAAALRLAAAVNYVGAGTVEFLVKDGQFFLLEMNTRLQVEHGVTEAVTGLDLVRWQIDIARGHPLSFEQSDLACRGHAVEARVYAEDPATRFAPQAGQLLDFRTPSPGLCRSDPGVSAGADISHHYDGLLCKLITHRQDRETATGALRQSLLELETAGLTTNRLFLRAALGHDCWSTGALHTLAIEQHAEELVAASRSHEQSTRAAIAATIWKFICSPPAADRVPWPGGYRQRRTSYWLVEGSPLEFCWRWSAAQAFEFEDPGASVEILQRRGDDLEMQINGCRRSYRLFAAGDRLWVVEKGGASTAIAALHPDRSSSTRDAERHYSSPGPGQVLRLLVAPGDAVSPGDELLVIESMKMENTLRANAPATVESVHVSAGELVGSGQRLVTMEGDR